MQPGNEFNLEQLSFLRTLIEALDAWPAELRQLAVSYEVFGSWNIVIRSKGERVQFTYDGKEHYLSAERLQRDPGDFSKKPQSLGGIGMRGSGVQEIATVLGFIRAHAG